jgi:hypothetical protein
MKLRQYLLGSLLVGFSFACAAQTRINPNNQINWVLATGNGVPSGALATCPNANPATTVLVGQPYFDSTNSVLYNCGANGWVKSPTQPFFGSSTPTSNCSPTVNNGAFFTNTSAQALYQCNGALSQWVQLASVSGSVVLANGIVKGTGSGSTSTSASAADIASLATAIDSGSLNTYVLTTTPAVSSLSNNTTVSFEPNSSNTSTAPTANLDGLGASAIVKQGGAVLAAGDIASNLATIKWNATTSLWELQNPQTTSVTLPPSSSLLSANSAGVPQKVNTGPNMAQQFNESQSVDARGGFSSANGAISCGDSILTSGTGHGAPVGQGVAPYLMTSIGSTATDLNCANAGASEEDSAFFDLAASPSPTDRGNPAIFADGGTNNAINGCVTAACLNGADQAVASAITWFATGPEDKKWFTSPTQWAPSGSWNGVNPYVWAVPLTLGGGCSVNDVLTLVGAGSGGTIKVTAIGVGGAFAGGQLLTPGVGYAYILPLTASGGTCTSSPTFEYSFAPQGGFTTAMQTTVSGSCMTNPTPLSFGQNGSVSLVYGALPASTYTMANFTFFVDGTPWTDVITRSSALSGNVQGVGRLLPGNPSWPFVPQSAVFTGIPAGTHTLSACTTSNGLFIPLYAAVLTPYGTDSSDGPNYTQSAVPPEGGNANALASYDYSLETLHTIQLFNSLGLNNVNYVDQGWCNNSTNPNVLPYCPTSNPPASPTVPVAMDWDTIRDFYGDTQVSLTNCAVTAGVASITNSGTNTYAAGQQAFISGFTTANCSQLNTAVGSFVTILSSGLSSTTFQFATSITTITSTADTAGVSIRVTDGCVDSNNAPVHPDTCGARHYSNSFIYQMKLTGTVSGQSLVTSTAPPTGTTGIPAIGWGPKNFNGCTWNGNVPIIGLCQLIGSTPFMQFLGSTGLLFQVSSTGSMTLAGGFSQTGAGSTISIAGPMSMTNNTFTWSSTSNLLNLNFDDQGGNVAFNFRNASHTNEWSLIQSPSGSVMELEDDANNLFRIQLTQNGVSDFAAGAGANAVRFGALGTTSGTGGIIVDSGGATPTPIAVIAGGGIAGGTVTTFAAGAAAGTSPTLVCLSGHVCDNFSGALTLTTGTAPTTGTLLTVTFPTTLTRAASANCDVSFQSATGPLTTNTWSASTTVITATATAALSASTAYTVMYVCGGK